MKSFKDMKGSELILRISFLTMALFLFVWLLVGMIQVFANQKCKKSNY